MSTQRSRIITAVVAALEGPGKPAGLSVVRRTTLAAECDDLPRIMVSRVKELTLKAFPQQLRSPLSDRHLTVRLDLWVSAAESLDAEPDPAADPDPEEALEPLLAWATSAMLADASWGGLAIDTTEDATEWEIDDDLSSTGHAWMDFTIRFSTKTADQEQKQ